MNCCLCDGLALTRVGGYGYCRGHKGQAKKAVVRGSREYEAAQAEREAPDWQPAFSHHPSRVKGERTRARRIAMGWERCERERAR